MSTLLLAILRMSLPSRIISKLHLYVLRLNDVESLLDEFAVTGLSVYYISRVALQNSIFEPPHDKTNKMICAPSEDRSAWAATQSDQESSQCAKWIAEVPMFLHADSEDSDQTGRMPRLI